MSIGVVVFTMKNMYSKLLTNINILYIFFYRTLQKLMIKFGAFGKRKVNSDEDDTNNSDSDFELYDVSNMCTSVGNSGV